MHLHIHVFVCTCVEYYWWNLLQKWSNIERKFMWTYDLYDFICFRIFIFLQFIFICFFYNRRWKSYVRNLAKLSDWLLLLLNSRLIRKLFPFSRIRNFLYLETARSIGNFRSRKGKAPNCRTEMSILGWPFYRHASRCPPDWRETYRHAKCREKTTTDALCIYALKSPVEMHFKRSDELHKNKCHESVDVTERYISEIDIFAFEK